MKTPIGWLFIYCLLTLNFLEASENYPPAFVQPFSTKTYDFPKTSLKASSDDNGQVIRIPLKRVGNLFLIEAQIDSLIGNFILDLGAPYLVLNSTYFRDYKVDKSYYSGTLFSGSNHVRRANINRLDIHGLKYTRLLADVTDLGEIENRRGVKILGLLGVALFKNYIFDLDLINRQLVLYKSRKEAGIDAELIFEVPITMHNNIISIPAKSRNVNLIFSLDTGAEKNIMDNKLSTIVYQGMKILKTSTITDGNGQKTEALLTVMDSIFVAGVKLRKMYTVILNLETISRAYDRKIDGMLGYPFFAAGRVVIDFGKKRLLYYQIEKRE